MKKISVFVINSSLRLIFFLPSLFVIVNVELPLSSCPVTGDVHPNAVPAATAPNDTEMIKKI